MASLDVLERAYDAQVHAVRESIVAFGEELWRSLPDYRDRSVERMIAAIVPRVQAGQIQTAQLTNAYLAQYAAELGIKFKTPIVRTAEVTSVRGVDPAVVYSRPGSAVYAALSEGKTVTEAVNAGGLRLTQLIGGDLQMGKRNQSRATLRVSGLDTFRRVLTGRENCGLCTIASTQRYWVKDLLPIHPGCDCGVAPLPPGSEFPQVIDPDLLENAHTAVGDHLGIAADGIDRGGRSPDYRKIKISLSDDGTATVSGTSLVSVRDHGEYGPVLTWTDQKFTGPSDL